MEFHAFVGINIAVKIKNLSILFSFSKAAICFFIAGKRYLALRDRIISFAIYKNNKNKLIYFPNIVCNKEMLTKCVRIV